MLGITGATMKIRYTGSFYGGSGWLSDEEWGNLEVAGWVVEWDAYPRCAIKEFDNVGDAIREFEKVTGEDASKEVCSCCGGIHSFWWQGGSASGKECIPYRNTEVPKAFSEGVKVLPSIIAVT
jgi:hypothetical protein